MNERGHTEAWWSSVEPEPEKEQEEVDYYISIIITLGISEPNAQPRLVVVEWKGCKEDSCCIHELTTMVTSVGSRNATDNDDDPTKYSLSNEEVERHDS